MMDRIDEMVERFLVAIGLSLSRLSPEETGMVTLLLAFLVVAAAMSRVLVLAHS